MSYASSPELLFAFPVILHGQVLAGVGNNEPEIIAAGSAEVRLAPDRVTMTVSVMARDSSAMATTGFGIDAERPRYDQPAPPVDAAPVYVANNSVRVSLTNLELIGQFVDTVLAAGASGVGGISYSSSQTTEGRRRAIALAVAEARGDAEAAGRRHRQRSSLGSQAQSCVAP